MSGFLKAADKQDRGNLPLYGSVPFMAKVKPIINELKKSAVWKFSGWVRHKPEANINEYKTLSTQL